MRTLCGLGVDYLQGFYLAYPLDNLTDLTPDFLETLVAMQKPGA